MGQQAVNSDEAASSPVLKGMEALQHSGIAAGNAYHIMIFELKNTPPICRSWATPVKLYSKKIKEQFRGIVILFQGQRQL